MASSTSPPAIPGLLYVTMAPKPSLPAAQFHNWYNNEHGPNRLQLPFIFENGYRYRATDISSSSDPTKMPEWLAMYDVTDMHEMTRATYLKLRDPKIQSARERETMSQIVIDRKFYDFVSERKKEGYVPLDSLPEGPHSKEAEGTVLVAVGMTLTDGPGSETEKDFDGWYEEEHIAMLAAIPGWCRTRRFKSSVIDPPTGAMKTQYLALHDYEAKNGLGGPEHKAAQATPWRDRIMEKRVEAKWRREYSLYYVFGAGSRDLASLADTKAGPDFVSTDGKLRTYTSPSAPVIESQITTPDGVVLPYRLEGNTTDPSAPLLIFVNSILTTYQMWDPFLSSFLPQNPQYRVLRFNQRGRSPVPAGSKKPIIMDTLADDVLTLLNGLRVPKAAAVIGVSQGGATTALFAIKYPHRTEKFISFDHQPVSASDAVWDERIVVAEGDASAPVTEWGSPDRGVGETLAEMTVRRWFAPSALGSHYHLGLISDNSRRFTTVMYTLLTHAIMFMLASRYPTPNQYISRSRNGIC